MKNAAPGCISFCCCPFLPPSQFSSAHAVIPFEGCMRLSLCLSSSCVRPVHLLYLSLSIGYYGISENIQTLTKAVHWGMVMIETVRAVWADVGSAIAFTWCGLSWFSTHKVRLVRAHIFLCCSVTVKMHCSCEGSVRGLSYTMTANCVRCCVVVLCRGFP